MIRAILVGLALVSLTACGKTVVQDRPVQVKVPVPVSCVLERPAKPETLAARTPDWDALDVRQKSAWVARHALDLRTYGEQLDAATGGCR